MKSTLAIIGSGISGMGCAHYLQDEYDITIFEKNDYLGGHTHTHQLEEEGKQFTIDTGFIVFNNETYPHLLNLFAELGVEKQESDMGFAVWNKLINLQYCGSGIAHLFAQKKNIFSVQFWKFLKEIQTFFKLARADLPTIKTSNETVKEYCERRGLSQYFMDNYLVPMSAAVRSASHGSTYDFPIGLLIPFFYNHGLLGVNEQFQWYTVKGGSNTYTKKIIAQGDFTVCYNEPVIAVHEEKEGVTIQTEKGSYTFDKVILATHANDSVRLLKTLSEEKRTLLEAFTYNKNTAVLHCDESVMPPQKKARAARVQTIESLGVGQDKVSTVYRVNKLQNPQVKRQYFVSINPTHPVDESKILKTLQYEHPLFSIENFALQERLQELNKESNVLFCGSYFGAGFHEDGLVAALKVVDLLSSKKNIL